MWFSTYDHVHALLSTKERTKHAIFPTFRCPEETHFYLRSLVQRVEKRGASCDEKRLIDSWYRPFGKRLWTTDLIDDSNAPQNSCRISCSTEDPSAIKWTFRKLHLATPWCLGVKLLFLDPLPLLLSHLGHSLINTNCTCNSKLCNIPLTG